LSGAARLDEAITAANRAVAGAAAAAAATTQLAAVQEMAQAVKLVAAHEARSLIYRITACVAARPLACLRPKSNAAPFHFCLN
jgi:hypothetical protein